MIKTQQQKITKIFKKKLNKLQELKIATDLISDTIHFMTDMYNCTAAIQMAFGHQQYMILDMKNHFNIIF